MTGRACIKCGAWFEPPVHGMRQVYCTERCRRATRGGVRSLVFNKRPDIAWMAEAACRRHDPDLWFSGDHSAAKRICLTECPVTFRCREYARWVRATSNDLGLFGVWAGSEAGDLP